MSIKIKIKSFLKALVAFGETIISTGSIGDGIYTFFNRLLIPFGLHQALNSVFWFEVDGIDDIGKLWENKSGGILGQTGMYMTGFFTVMMFGLPAAALAMYHTAKENKKKLVTGLLMVASLSNNFTEVVLIILEGLGGRKMLLVYIIV